MSIQDEPDEGDDFVVIPAPVSTDYIWTSDGDLNILGKGVWHTGGEEKANPFMIPGVCECGAEKTGSPGHSEWCPKKEKI